MITTINMELQDILTFIKEIWSNAEKLAEDLQNGLEYRQMYKMSIFGMCCNMKADFLKNTQSGYIKLNDIFAEI